MESKLERLTKACEYCVKVIVPSKNSQRFCKEICRRTKYRIENKEKVAKRKRNYRENNKEKIADMQKDYRETHRDIIAERSRKY